MADAETLRPNYAAIPGSCAADYARLGMTSDAYRCAVMAARAAFRAVPGLRG